MNSKILRRPMFRKGGDVGGGIMTGIRENFKVGSARERLEKVYADYPVQSIDPVSQLLITGGLRGLSETGGGSTAGNLAKAFLEPTEQLFKNIGAQDKAKREIALAGEQLDIESEQAKELAQIKNQMKDYFAAQTPEAQFEVLFKGYTDESQPSIIKNNARNLAAFEVKHGDKNYVQMSFTQDKKGNYAPNWRTVPVGGITYNPMLNLAYRRVKVAANDASDYVPLDPNTLQPYLDTKG